MDKKNTIIGVGLLIAAFAALIYSNKTQPRPVAPAPAPTSISAPATSPEAGTPSTAVTAPAALPTNGSRLYASPVGSPESCTA